MNWEYYLKVKLTKVEGNKGKMEVGNMWNYKGRKEEWVSGEKTSEYKSSSEFWIQV